MKITKWVDFGQEVEVNIGADDIRAALAEAFAVVTKDRLGEGGPSRNDVLTALNYIGTFLGALTDEQIGLLNFQQRVIIQGFMLKASNRFRPPTEGL